MLTHRRFKSFSMAVSFVLGLTFGTCCAPNCSGYSVLTHEAIIDAAWKDSIVPVLLKRFPNATPEQLLQAHAYAYGGGIIQDMGYYPFGNAFFSDLPRDFLCLGLANGGRNISRSLKLLCLKRNIGNLSAIQEKIGYLLRQRGNERFVGKQEVIGG